MFVQNVFVPALALLANGVAASKVIDLTPKNFDAEVFSGTPSLVEFFAPWCGHCKKLAPVYDDLATSYAKAGDKIKIAKVDGDAHKDLSQKYEISGFPTMKFFDGTSKTPEDYKGGRSLEDFQNWIEEKTGVKAKRPPKLPSHIKHLTDKTFNDAVGKDQAVFVAFTAPWCGHCKTLAPTWEKLATDFEGDSKVLTIAKVDAEANKDVASAQGISSYPTIKYFPPGSSTPEDYEGGRDQAFMMQFLNTRLDLHRAIGGGLDLKAGTIAALDTIIAKASTAGDELKSITADAIKAAEGLKDKYASYYLKVLDKMGQNPGYLEKETSRLEGIMSKGGLIREKEDDIMSRLNILRKFRLPGGSQEDKDKDEL